ncbi:hypothetical protein [Tabrizicola caldifontis]|uniref:hypothetical protein n=1 Tax=Tabrizicola caldifontis TaxID=2528036 RepID=UPI0010807EA0|nr:hypothetical protein [Rhodobacter sp. YIM 73028]
MPRRFRLTRRFPAAMTEEAHRAFRRFQAESGLEPGEALSFIFENLNGMVDADELAKRLMAFRADLDERKT